MKPSEQEKLLKEILPEEDLRDFQQASLEHGLTFLRQRRRRGYLLRASALATVLSLVTLGLLLKPHRAPQPDNSTAQLPPAPQSAPVAASPVKFISDDELLALFPNRQVALIGKPGQQRLVFLDKPHAEPL